ncbi:unnamed protein product [Acanthoscelides obtectus]|uniref:Uncharacterized protein n=1 Tax=Acanthoscelides obtectus TaxID=200917 RepID=A0A9P0K6J5_ACAOB|nr:unnamed protein product [Acanthoscelides obtectus]CAK1627545.1 hypothetical protein AOBTE_LOCUS4656 [Acanthoscelides obtectus]
MAFDNCFTMMYILVLEYVGPKWRTFVANMSIAIFFTFAASILPWIAYYVADWRILVTSHQHPWHWLFSHLGWYLSPQDGLCLKEKQTRP